MYPRIPISRAFAEMACPGDPSLAGLGLPGACSRTPTLDHPLLSWHLLSIRALLPPPTLRHISSGAAPGPSPPSPPFSRWPPRCGTSRARAPPPPAAPAGPGFPSAAAAVAAAARSDAGRAQGRRLVRDASARASSAPRRIPFRGRGSIPPSAPRPGPAHWPTACCICKRTPPPPQTTPPYKYYPVSSHAEAAPPRPAPWPGLAGTCTQPWWTASQVQAQVLFPSVTPDLRSPMVLLMKNCLGRRLDALRSCFTPRFSQPGGGGQKR